MKNSILFFAFALLFFVQANAQNKMEKTIIGVLNIDTKGLSYDAEQMGNITRIELEKLSLYQVLDKYDMAYLAKKEDFPIEHCFGRLCMVEAGKILKTQKMLTGSVEKYGAKILVNIQLIDVETKSIEKSKAMEFLYIENQISTMIGLCLKKLYDQDIDEELLTKLTKPFDYKNTINTPNTNKLNLSGPRLGAILFTGQLAKVFSDSRENGGMDGFPLLSQFGYQFEVQYLSQGNFQALFEIIPLITGLEQGFFIPNCSFLNGFRNSKTGLEFAFGPTFSVAKKVSGYYDENNNWHLPQEWYNQNAGLENPYPITKRLDSRGHHEITTGFVFAVGKTFKSGRLNIPVNLFYIPGKEHTHRFGISVGYNTKN